ncbi:MAG: hypothetical protein AB1925_26040 [Actinomycetota bacterium]
MQPCTPPRKPLRRVNGHDPGSIPRALPAVDGDNPKQIDGQLSSSTPDAGPHRAPGGVVAAFLRPSRLLALDHS